MNKKDFNNDFGQPVLNTKKDYETFMVENSSRPARDETVAERADRHMFIWHGGEMPKHYDDPFIKKVDVMAGLPEVNKIVDQKLKEEDKKLFPTGPKLADVPILKRNIKYPKPIKTNPTIERYKNFKEEKKFKAEEKKFNEEFEKEYSNKAVENRVQAKINNKETLTMNDHFINEHRKDNAEVKLAARNAAAKIVELAAETAKSKFPTEATPAQFANLAYNLERDRQMRGTPTNVKEFGHSFNENKKAPPYPGMKVWQKKKKNSTPIEPEKITLPTPAPFVPLEMPKPNLQMAAQEKRFNQMVEESKQEKERMNNSGIAGLIGGVK
tara:strand:- start:432 stop:1409 length:978 start_codon:yes stop_codon:yes gene_type:complete